ncbi:pyrophosphatase PpaX [Oceanobacillus sp. CAU 1775]
MSIRTILFDLDGTLIDSNQLIFTSFKHTFDSYNLNFTDEEILEFNGPPLIETFTKIDPLRVDEMVETYREHNKLVHDEFVKVFPEVIETLEILQQKNIKMGVVTTKMAPGVKLAMELTGIEKYFGSIVTLSDVTHAKPHPEPVLKAMHELGGVPETTLMVGDNSHDIEAGKNAGVRTAGVAWAQKGRERLLSYQPNYMLENMKDILQLVEV